MCWVCLNNTSTGETIMMMSATSKAQASPRWENQRIFWKKCWERFCCLFAFFFFFPQTKEKNEANVMKSEIYTSDPGQALNGYSWAGGNIISIVLKI